MCFSENTKLLTVRLLNGFLSRHRVSSIYFYCQCIISVFSVLCTGEAAGSRQFLCGSRSQCQRDGEKEERTFQGEGEPLKPLPAASEAEFNLAKGETETCVCTHAHRQAHAHAHAHTHTYTCIHTELIPMLRSRTSCTYIG